MQIGYLSEKDIRQIEAKGLTLEEVEQQVERFEKGIPPLPLIRPCNLNDGIIQIPEEDISRYVQKFVQVASDGRITKFVPASGAATRLFKSPLAIYNNPRIRKMEDLVLASNAGDKDAEFTRRFIDHLDRFAFFNELKSVLAFNNLDLVALQRDGEVHQILEWILTEKGLNYANLPKGLISFHLYEEHTRTPLEEHVMEALEYAIDKNSIVRIHFTISRDYKDRITRVINDFCHPFSIRGVQFRITYSYQDSSTDTIAVDKENKPLRNRRGRLIFRPAGHGALLKNLNEQDADIVLIKNIDNVVPDYLKPDTYLYKKILTGYLVEIQDKLFGYLHRLEEGAISPNIIAEMKSFAESDLLLNFPEDWQDWLVSRKMNYLFKLFHRPLRVCGMVENSGEPGGGPYWVMGQRGPSLQIVETSQIDLNDPKQVEMHDSAKYFNPVDLACGICDYKGKKFNLMDFRDLNTGIITSKSRNGAELKALELPGLWNGSMAHWITVFIRVPSTTLSPVKTINDLLKQEHLPV